MSTVSSLEPLQRHYMSLLFEGQSERPDFYAKMRKKRKPATAPMLTKVTSVGEEILSLHNNSQRNGRARTGAVRGGSGG